MAEERQRLLILAHPSLGVTVMMNAPVVLEVLKLVASEKQRQRCYMKFF